MLDNFIKFFKLSEDERKDLFSETAKKLDTREAYVEKDFWVCLALEIMFNHLESSSPKLLFKGGTSLSKIYGVIKRFSEDIDITVFAESLGCNLKDVKTLGNKQRKRFFAELSEKCDSFLYGSLVESLRAKFAEVGATGVEVNPGDDHTIFILYPSLFSDDTAEYVKPSVKIESGARSAVEPNNISSVAPYTEEVLQIGLEVNNICTIRAERTFCDKIIILHGICNGYTKEGRLPQDHQRVARHFYDLAMMMGTEVGEAAIDNPELQESARSHAELAFPSVWRGYDTARPGSFTLVPSGDLLSVVEADYRAMSSMIFGKAPSFDEIMEAIQSIEQALNASAAPSPSVGR